MHLLPVPIIPLLGRNPPLHQEITGHACEMSSRRGWATGNRDSNSGGRPPRVRIRTPGDGSWPRHGITIVIPSIDGYLRGRERWWRKSSDRSSRGILWQDGRRTPTRDRGRWPRERSANGGRDISGATTTRLPRKVGPAEFPGHTKSVALALRLAWVRRNPTIIKTKFIRPERGSN